MRLGKVRRDLNGIIHMQLMLTVEAIA